MPIIETRQIDLFDVILPSDEGGEPVSVGDIQRIVEEEREAILAEISGPQEAIPVAMEQEARARVRPRVDIVESWLRPGSIRAREDGAFEITPFTPPVEAGQEGQAQEPVVPNLLRVPLREREKMLRLIELRDATRRLLSAEVAQAPDEQIDELRAALNRIYDDFLDFYGPINFQRHEGRIRYPNLYYFQDDPDAPLLSALESVDPDTGYCEKAPIFFQKTVRPDIEITRVDEPSDALAVSLDRKGYVDIRFIAELLGCEEGDAVRALTDRIYFNPESRVWETAESYLSGNVLAKLQAAQAAVGETPFLQRNIDALEAVKPDALTAEDISVGLGAPWVPVDVYQAFFTHLFGARPGDVEASYHPAAGGWDLSVGNNRHLARGTQATTVYGTRRMGLLDIGRALLNQRDIIVRERVDGTYVMDRDATLAAREKGDVVRQEWERWVWTDPARSVRLVDIYNQTFNDRVSRTFDGSHLSLPGSNQSVHMRPHQKDAVWRGIADGNVMLAHEVGTGKSFIESAIAMESRRLGLSRKPVLTVPGHMIEQVARDFMHLYPNARLLTMTRDDLKPANIDAFCARVAVSDVDCVIMTHDAFLRIPLSKQVRREILEEDLAQLQGLGEGDDPDERRAARQGIQRIQRQITALDQATDPTVTFDTLGIDLLIVDESHVFKGLPIVSKTQSRASEGSKQAYEMYLRTRYLDRTNPGRGVVFATGTPLTNSLQELYVLQRFLSESRLRETGLYHFDAWAATFGENVTTFELAPGGGYRLYTRFSRFKNIPELVSMTREFMDVKFASEIEVKRPELEGGERQIVVVQPAEHVEQYFGDLVERAQAVGGRQGARIAAPTPEDPDRTIVDNILRVMGDARKAALDMRLIDPGQIEIGAKLIAAADRIAQRWHDTADKRLTQLVFCDLGTPKKGDRFDVYHELKRLLLERGVSEDEVAFAQDAKSDIAKQRLYTDMNNGRVRVMIASTRMAGVGVNVQERLYALSHLDFPWRPCDIEQREGRILRQGNLNDFVIVEGYVTERSFDAYILQANERKSAFIAQILKGDANIRTAEDVDTVVLNYAQMKALASGNPLVLRKAEVEAEIQRMSRLLRHENDRRHEARLRLARAPEQRALADQHLAYLQGLSENFVAAVHEHEERDAVLLAEDDARREAIKAAREEERAARRAAKEAEKEARKAAREAEKAARKAAEERGETYVSESPEVPEAPEQGSLGDMGGFQSPDNAADPDDRDDVEEGVKEEDSETESLGRLRLERGYLGTIFPWIGILKTDGEEAQNREEIGRDLLTAVGRAGMLSQLDNEGLLTHQMTLRDSVDVARRAGEVRIFGNGRPLDLVIYAVYDRTTKSMNNIFFEARIGYTKVARSSAFSAGTARAAGLLERVDNMIASIEDLHTEYQERLMHADEDLERLRAFLAQPSPIQDQINTLKGELATIDRELGIDGEALEQAIEAAAGQGRGAHQEAPAMPARRAAAGDRVLRAIEAVAEPDEPQQQAVGNLIEDYRARLQALRQNP